MSARAQLLRRLGAVASTSGTHSGHAAVRSCVSSSFEFARAFNREVSDAHAGGPSIGVRGGNNTRHSGGFHRGYAAGAAQGGDGGDWDEEGSEGSIESISGDAGDESDESNADTPYVGSASAGDVDTVDPESLPTDDVLPPHLMRPSWLQKKRNRKQKGSYEGFLTEIDSYPDFEPPGGALYNVNDHAAATVETSDELLKEFTKGYIDEQRKIYESNGGKTGLSDSEFIDEYNKCFEDSSEESDSQIITWEVVMVHEAGGQNDHPLNRKVVMNVKAADLQKETGVSDEALQYIIEICGPRYDTKTDVLKIISSRSKNREHNRQWCLKVLYDLIMEGNREFPSVSYRFSPEGPTD